MDKKDLKHLINEHKVLVKDLSGAKKQHDIQTKDLEKLYNEYKQIKSYADGGSVESDDDSDLYNLLKSVKKSFKTPQPKSSSVQHESQQDKYDRIRQQNSQRALGQRTETPSQDPDEQVQKDMGLYDGGKVQHYADGTDDVEPADPVTGSIDPNSPEGLDMIRNASYPEAKQSTNSDVPDELPININASLAKPADIKDVEEKDDSDKAAIEKPYDTEELAADLKSEEKNKDEKDYKADDKKAEDDLRENSDKKEELRDTASEDESNLEDKSQPEDIKQILEQSNTPNDLAKAQQQRDINLARAKMEKGAALIGSGLGGRAGIDISKQMAIIKDQENQAGLPVQKYQEQIANQQNDPNSDMSKVTRQYLASKGIKVGDDTSAATVFKVAPYLQKDQALQMGIQKVLLQGQIKQGIVSQQQAGADKRAQAKNAIEQQKADAMQKNAQANKQQGQDNKVNQDFEKMNKAITSEVASSRSPIGKASLIKQGAERLEALGQQYKNTNQLDNRQIAELARGLDAMLSAGAATVSGSNHLLPSTSSGNLAKIEEYITNIPQGARQKEFVDRMMETVRREKELANKQVSSAQKKLLAGYGHLQKTDPDRYNSILKEQGLLDESANNVPAVDADLTKMTPDQLKAYIKAHGG